MLFDVYCDESRPDLFASQRPQAKYLVIGSLWMPAGKRQEFKKAIHDLRNKHKIGGEFKWQKVSPSRQGFYCELVRWFANVGNDLRFRCIVVDREKVNLLKFHDGDPELGFYKFYYQMLHHWILDFNQYAIFCDDKKNRIPARLRDLEQCLSRSNLSSEILRVQAISSGESVLIQLTDVLTGAASAKLNASMSPASAKAQVLTTLEGELRREIGPTPRFEQKFNVFRIDLSGGW
jgi:hypothetical protein